MGLTIPRRIRPNRGDRRVTCDTCGFVRMRSDCWRDEDGYLRCPSDDDGEATKTLHRMNAEAALEPSVPPYGDDW